MRKDESDFMGEFDHVTLRVQKSTHTDCPTIWDLNAIISISAGEGAAFNGTCDT